VRVKSQKVVNGSHEVASVWDREGMLLGVGTVSLLWPCVWVLNQVRVQGQEGLQFLFVLGREVTNVARRINSHSLVNESHMIVSVRGWEVVSSVVWIVLLLWSCVGFLSHCVANQLWLGGGVLCCCCHRTCSKSARVKSLISRRLVPGGMWSGKEVCAGVSANGYCRCCVLVVRVWLFANNL